MVDADRTDVDAIFTALADPTRRAVLRSLAEGGAATATQLANRFPVSRQAVAKHLSALGEAGLVAPERTGREVRYHITPDPLLDAMGWMAAVGSQWDRRLLALRDRVEARAGTASVAGAPDPAES